MLSHGQDETNLSEAIKTTLLQLCKVGAVYESELCIQGTIGLTVDKKSILLVHLDEDIVLAKPPVMSPDLAPGTCPSGPPAAAVPELTSVTQSQADAQNTVNHANPGQPADLRLLGAEVLYSLQDYLNRPPPGAGLPSQSDPPPPSASSSTSCPKSCPGVSDLVKAKQYYTEPADMGSSNIKVTLHPLSDTIPIDIDSDSESFGGIHFDDDTDPREEDNDKNKLFLDSEPKVVCDVKNIIVIDDGNELQLPSFSNDQPRVSPSSSMTSNTMTWCNTNTSKPFVPLLPPPSLPSFSGGKLSRYRSISMDEQHDQVPLYSSKLGIEQFSPGKSIASDLDEYYDTPSKNTSGKDGMGVTCQICGKNLTNTWSLESHLVGTHGVTETPTLGKISHRSCNECGKKFRFKTSLDKHVQKHKQSQERPYKCQVCRNSYVYTESLQIHLSAHSDNFECFVCKKVYSNKISFQKHIMYLHETMKKGIVKTQVQEDDN